jgi:ribosomal protein S18 acetylase RimI-like enzyme
MSIEIKTLENNSIKDIHTAFTDAFADYLIDISYMTPEVMKFRFQKNGFQPGLSAGLFDNGKLKGFTITGTGLFKGHNAAFDIMTGMVKDYRGKGLANKMFDFIKTQMKAHTINKFYLEVLQENQAAIKAYKKTGFQITRELNCYLLNLKKFKLAKQIQTIIYIDNIQPSEIDSFDRFTDWEPSWENHFESIKRITNEVDIFTARCNGKNIGILVYYPTLKWIMCLAVHKSFRRKGVASALFEYLAEYLSPQTEEIKILNVQADDKALNEFLMNSGCGLLTGQYEMEYSLNSE